MLGSQKQNKPAHALLYTVGIRAHTHQVPHFYFLFFYIRKSLALFTARYICVSSDVYGCSTVVLIRFTCPAITVVTVILRALDRVRERALGCFARSLKSPPARRHVVSSTPMGGQKWPCNMYKASRTSTLVCAWWGGRGVGWWGGSSKQADRHRVTVRTPLHQLRDFFGICARPQLPEAVTRLFFTVVFW